MTARQQAMALGETRYHGSPCKHCARTYRELSGHCVHCRNEWQRNRYGSLTGLQYNRLLLNRRRTQALARMAVRQQRKEHGGALSP